MPINILMPALSPTMEQGNLVKWLKAEGDKVKAGDVLAEIETDKATMEVEAVDEGTLGKILVPEGTNDVPVNKPIAIMLEEGEDASTVNEPAGFAQPAIKPADEKSAQLTEQQVAKQTDQKPASQPAQAGKADEQALAGEKGYGVVPGAEPVTTAKAAAGSNSGERVFASPLARRLAKERGLDLSAMKGSGPHGRIVKSDVENAPATGSAKAAPAAAQASTGGGFPLIPDEQIKALFEPGTYDVVPHSGMRKTIASRMQQSKVVVPHYYLAVDVDLDALMKMREEMNAVAPLDDGKPVWRLSVNDFIIKALAITLKRHPEANASWTEAGMLVHKVVDIGVAVAIPDGLITPIIRNAHEKSLSAISQEMAGLARKARDKKLKPHEYQGGTTAISNLGMYGVKNFTAVVNPPHSTILAVAAGEKRAVVRGDQIVIATQMTVTISCDHRVLDGAQSAQMMQTFKGLVEKPLGLVV
ncbi:pyruvate dehydrogenase complex dihydrolipoamide acetyltransferase [Terrihabitans rhizophilus]|uniref:Acetyltransferase component of pyruvate dehydrogenase complex n=1 Tax=Terrihabitans rhizophilus TaxID=3092662 RepID=A0ABU4RKK9_9HYPH|nr:pyruvate dehydrogenase complex dihydrolipoamide acetyltransferase [Terrihabitans sp. PJ23]MDX6805372.1 pyruvate dehydrogenase complex dihydrolipoamide acetyltransferase [Terrihabitans sp. PJ23]